MFIEQGIKPGNEFWRYIAGTIAVFAMMIFGQIPFAAAVAFKIGLGHEMPETETDMLKMLEPNLSLFLLLLSFLAGFVGLVFVIRNLHSQKLKDITTGRKKVDWKRILFSFGLWSCFSVITTVIAYFSSPEDFVFNFQPQKFAILFVIATIMIPIQTSFEEFVFRGYLMQGIAAVAKNKWVPLLVTSIGFGLLHITNPEVGKMGNEILIYYIGTGLFLGIIALMDNGLELSLGFHAANNWTTALLVTSDWTALQTYSVFKDVSEPSAEMSIYFPVLVIFPILLFVFSKKYGWDNWRDKLFGKIENPQ